MEEGRYKATTACRQFEAELEAHLEGVARPFIASHAHECPACSDLLADLQLIQVAARDLPQEEPSSAVWTTIRSSIQSLNDACAQFRAELQADLEGEAQPFIASHAQECPACSDLLADLQLLQVAARDLPQEEPPPAVWANIRKNLVAQGAFAAPACTQFSTDLEPYLEGEARPLITAHAQECPRCNSLLADLQLIQAAARDLPQEEPSPALWANIRQSLATQGAFAPSLCEQFSSAIEDYLEGEPRPFVVSHAQECRPCGAMLADLESIREAARTLPQEDPSRVVWANVRARLEAEGAFGGAAAPGWRQLLPWRFLPQPAPLGALAGLVILGALLSLPSRDISRWGGPQEATASSAPTEMASLAPPPEDISLAHVVSDLESNFKANEASMTPDLKATYEKSLVSLDGSIRECLDSLHHEPGNTLAHDYLLTAYTRKAEVLSSALEFEGR
jgi:predicted anti-sigma-YlaC factor YlaD